MRPLVRGRVRVGVGVGVGLGLGYGLHRSATTGMSTEVGRGDN